MPGEIWKDICGYEGLYMVSNKGRIKSLPHKVKRGWAECITDEIILIPKSNGHYDKVCLYSGYKKNNKQQYVHRLVATAFIPNPDKYPQIDHIDGNRINNYASNLRWVTAEENANNQHRLEELSRVAKQRRYEKKINDSLKAIFDTGISKLDLIQRILNYTEDSQKE